MKTNKILPDSSISKIWEKIKELTQKLEECFQSVSDGKTLVASAITDMGVETDAMATFTKMADNIKSIETGVDTSGTTATAADITIGKTAWVNGQLVTGTRPAPVNSQTGSMYINAPGKNATGTSGDYSAVTYHALTFPTPFDTVPKVSTTYSGSERVICRGATNITKTGCQFIIASDRGGTYGITVYWTATV